MIQVLFPSWKFFVEMSQSPLLHYRHAGDEGVFSDWIDAFPPPRRRLQHLFLNGEGNLLLAEHSLVEKFIREISETEDETKLHQSTSYQLVESLIRSKLPAKARKFQFRIGLFSIRNFSAEEVLVSPEVLR